MGQTGRLYSAGSLLRRSTANNSRTGLVLDAVNMAIFNRRPGTQPPLAQRQSVHLSEAGVRWSSGASRTLLQQLHGRELRLDLEKRADPSSFMAESPEGKDGDLRIRQPFLERFSY